MLVLGIESSCDDTSAAVLENGSRVLSNVISDQNTTHSKYGGVVPELAGRCHVESIDRVITNALNQSKTTLKQIDLIAVTVGPGLVSSLLVGLNTAKALAYALQKPLVGVNHLEGHLLAIFLQETVEFPFVALTVSGGHTDLYRVDGFGDYKILGRTRDDAAGESFDKVAKMLKLGYPGGPIIEEKATHGNPLAHRFPRAFLEKNSLDFSFRDNGARFKMEYINGSSPTPSQFNSALAYVSYKIIPSFYEYSFLKKNNLDKIYFHTDLNLENFLILDNKLYVVDIDLEAWKDKDHYHVGKVLGYPECCVSAYIDKKLAHAHEHAIYHEFYKEDLWTSETADILMYPLYPFRIYNHIPCSWSCQKTLENNKIRKKIWNYQPDQLFLWIDQDFNFITKKPDSFYPTGLHTIEFS